MPALQQTQPAPEMVLAKAVLKASKQLGLKQSDLAAVLGIHRTAISRLNKTPALNPESKEGELALLIIRIARSLFTLAGGDEQWMQHFMQSTNKVTGGIPKEQIKTIQGLVSVLEFVDAMRGKI